MISAKRIVLDANILMRAVLGRRVRNLLQSYEATVAFYTSDTCAEDARHYLPDVAARRGLDATVAMDLLDTILSIVHTADRSLYEIHESTARERMAGRDMDDWPVVAAALLLDCPVWTEDQDFFGSGIATWTTQNIELYLRS